MEYAREVFFNIGYKKIDIIRNRIGQVKSFINRVKELTAFIFCILKKWINIGIDVVKKNKFITITLFLLITFMIADFILIDNFFKIFVTLY